MKLWDFALDFYGLDGVAPLCLDWQDRAGVDVNVLIYAVWLACRTGKDVTEAQIAEADERARDWRDAVVRPLRAVRRHLKSNPGLAGAEEAESLRTHIKRLELAAERIELKALDRAAPLPTQGFATASAERIRQTMQLVLGYYNREGAEISIVATELPLPHRFPPSGLPTG